MKVWSTLTALLGVAAAADATEPTDAVEDADAYSYNYHYCTTSSNCYGSARCGHYSYWYNHNHYDFKTCVAPTTCNHWLKRGSSNVYVYCY